MASQGTVKQVLEYFVSLVSAWPKYTLFSVLIFYQLSNQSFLSSAGNQITALIELIGYYSSHSCWSSQRTLSSPSRGPLGWHPKGMVAMGVTRCPKSWLPSVIHNHGGWGGYAMLLPSAARTWGEDGGVQQNPAWATLLLLGWAHSLASAQPTSTLHRLWLKGV